LLRPVLKGMTIQAYGSVTTLGKTHATVEAVVKQKGTDSVLAKTMGTWNIYTVRPKL